MKLLRHASATFGHSLAQTCLVTNAPPSDVPMLARRPPPTPPSDPGVDAARPVQQRAAVARALEGLKEEEEPKPSEQLAEDGSCHHHEGGHHHEPQNDEGRAAVVVKVTADGKGSMEDLEKQSDNHGGVRL